MIPIQIAPLSLFQFIAFSCFFALFVGFSAKRIDFFFGLDAFENISETYYRWCIEKKQKKKHKTNQKKSGFLLLKIVIFLENFPPLNRHENDFFLLHF